MDTRDRTRPPSTRELLDLIEQLERLANAPSAEAAPDRKVAREFFANSWRSARYGLLARTGRIRVEPAPGPAPRTFRFSMDLPYLRQTSRDGEVEVAPGPLTGRITYRPDLMLAAPGEPVLYVTVDNSDWSHPNYSRTHGWFCTGQLPAGPIELEPLLEILYVFASYQSYSVEDPADRESAALLAARPEILDALGEPAPLW